MQIYVSRIVVVSSLAYRRAKNGINFADINCEGKPFDTVDTYGQSKLANLLFAKELAIRIEDTGIKVYALHPGVIMTELSRHIEERMPKLLTFFAMPLARFFFKTPFHGAQTTLYCTLDDSIANESGIYYSDCAHGVINTEHGKDMKMAKKLWEVSEKMVGL